MNLRPSPALAVSVVALVIALGGVAWSAIPGADGVVHGCYRKAAGLLVAQGTLRVIDPSRGQTCSSAEQALDFNQTGPPGAAGTARAYGLVDLDNCTLAACNPSPLSNATVTHPAEGLFCISVAGASPGDTGVVATQTTFRSDPTGETQSQSLVLYDPNGDPLCGAAFAVRTDIVQLGGLNTIPFDEGFFFVVP
jgi:hypothetical protein